MYDTIYPKALWFKDVTILKPDVSPVAGANVAITYTSLDPTAIASDLAKEYGVQVKVFRCDVTVSSQVDAMVHSVEVEFGCKVDMAIANAGICIHEEAHQHTDGEPAGICE